MQNLPPAVLENIKNKETVVFVGSGFSRAAGLPSSPSIASSLARKIQASGKEARTEVWSQLDKASELFEIVFGRARLISDVQSFLRTAPQDTPSASHQLLASLVKHGFVRTIVTTNYDTLIEDACALQGAPITVVAHESQLSAAAGDLPVLYKIHGDFSHPELLVLTQADLQRWNRLPEARPIVTQLEALFDRNALLFLGYSLSDFNILSLLLGSDFSTRGAPRHKRFAAMYSEENLADTASRLRQYDVEPFHCPDAEGLLRSLLLNLPVKLLVTHLLFNYPSWYPDQHAQYGGIETFIDYLQRYSRDITHETVAAYRGHMLAFAPAQLANTSYPVYPASFYFFRAVAKAVLETILNSRRVGNEKLSDVIHVHFLAFAPMCEDTGIATVCTSHSLLSLDLAFTKGLFDGDPSPGARQEIAGVYEAEAVAATSTSFVTTVSSAHEEEVRRIGARSVKRIEAPLDAGQFQVEEDPRTARERAQLPDKFTITYVGRPDRRKGIEILISACEQLASTNPDFQLLLVGYGFRHSSGTIAFGAGRYWFDSSGLEKRGVRVELRQAFDPMRAGIFYSASDIVVVPSLYEPMGYVVLEAMSCARPVVAARTGGIVEAINDGVNGMLFESGDADDLAKKLAALHSDPEARKRLGLKARQDMESRRPVREIVSDWQELYRHAAFAFGESLYPSAELLEDIRRKCDNVSMYGRSSLGVYEAAVIGCQVAKAIMAEPGRGTAAKFFSLPEGVPVDGALFRAIALEMQRGLRRRGVSTEFSVAALRDVMTDLALADLNREHKKESSLLLLAEETKKKLQDPWFQKMIGKATSS